MDANVEFELFDGFDGFDGFELFNSQFLIPNIQLNQNGIMV